MFLRPQTGMCSFFPRSRFQEFAFQEELITVPRLTKVSQCLAGAPHERQAKLRPERREGLRGSTPLLASTGMGSWRLSGKWCLVPPREAQGNGDVELFLSPCSELGPKEQATLEELGTRKGFLRQLRIAGDGRCLHVKGTGMVVSQCADFHSFFRVQEGRPLCEGEKPKRCLSMEGSGTGGSLALEPCERTSDAFEKTTLRPGAKPKPLWSYLLLAPGPSGASLSHRPSSVWRAAVGAGCL